MFTLSATMPNNELTAYTFIDHSNVESAARTAAQESKWMDRPTFLMDVPDDVLDIGYSDRWGQYNTPSGERVTRSR